MIKTRVSEFAIVAAEIVSERSTHLHRAFPAGSGPNAPNRKQGDIQIDTNFHLGLPSNLCSPSPPPHLGRKVGDRAAIGAHCRAGAVEIAQPEIGELDLLQTAGPRQQDVVQLHVAVANVLVVRVADPADNLKKRSMERRILRI